MKFAIILTVFGVFRCFSGSCGIATQESQVQAPVQKLYVESPVQKLLERSHHIRSNHGVLLHRSRVRSGCAGLRLRERRVLRSVRGCGG